MLARLIVLLTSVSAHLLTSPGMFFILIVVADGHLRRNTSTFRNDSGTGMNGTGLKTDDMKSGPNSGDRGERPLAAERSCVR